MFLLCIPPPPTSSLHFQEAIKHIFGCDAPKLYKNFRTNGISEKLLLIQIYSDSASLLDTYQLLWFFLENNNNFKVKHVVSNRIPSNKLAEISFCFVYLSIKDWDL